jgi:hypothetical protein
MSDRRFKITLSFEVAELTPQGDRPYFRVPGVTWTECPAETVLVIERRLLDVLEAMHALGLDVLAAQGDTEALARVVQRHTAAGAIPPGPVPDQAPGPGPSTEA